MLGSDDPPSKPPPTPVKIRLATLADAGALAGLLADQLHESYPGHIGSTAAELRRDVLGPSTTGRPLRAVAMPMPFAILTCRVALALVIELRFVEGA
jgi:hypothetical protein